MERKTPVYLDLEDVQACLCGEKEILEVIPKGLGGEKINPARLCFENQDYKICDLGMDCVHGKLTANLVFMEKGA